MNDYMYEATVVKSKEAGELQFSEKDITIKRGTKPIILLSIHHTEKGTVRTNETLHDQEGFYSFIYHGHRDTSWNLGPKKYALALMDEMFETYGAFGMISLHRRANYIEQIKDIRKRPLDRNLFELGTLDGQTLDRVIKENFTQAMFRNNIFFDDNIYFRGGTEIKDAHQKYNDPKYKKGKRGHNPSRNKIQIAQLELNGQKPWLNEYLLIVRALADNMQMYMRRR